MGEVYGSAYYDLLLECFALCCVDDIEVAICTLGYYCGCGESALDGYRQSKEVVDMLFE